MKDEDLDWRMYFFVPYNLSPIQQGIQAGHAGLEYANRYKNEKAYIKFVNKNKTFIILNGGTTNSGHMGSPKGTMQEYFDILWKNGVKCVPFYEPDINSALTAIAFLVDERVWDYEKYLEFKDFILNENENLDLIESFRSNEVLIDKYPKEYKKWKSMMGNEKNIFLRDFLKDKKLV